MERSRTVKILDGLILVVLAGLLLVLCTGS